MTPFGQPAGQVDDHPEAILEHVNPRTVLLAHWEDFFEPQTEPISHVPGTDVDRFLERFEAAISPETQWWMPVPGQRISVARALDSAQNFLVLVAHCVVVVGA